MTGTSLMPASSVPVGDRASPSAPSEVVAWRSPGCLETERVTAIHADGVGQASGDVLARAADVERGAAHKLEAGPSLGDSGPSPVPTRPDVGSETFPPASSASAGGQQRGEGGPQPRSTARIRLSISRGPGFVGPASHTTWADASFALVLVEVGMRCRGRVRPGVDP